MDKIVEYKFDHKHKVIIDRFKGEILFNDLMNHEKTKLSDPEYNDSYSIFVNIRDATFKLSDAEKEIMYNLLKKTSTEINMNRKCAFITNTPLEVVNSELFKKNIKKFAPMNIKTFSTKEAAYLWLKV